MPLIFEDFPNRDYARQFAAQVKHRYALDGLVQYGLCDDAGKPLPGWVNIERPLCKRDGRKIEDEIEKLAKDYGGVFTGT